MDNKYPEQHGPLWHRHGTSHVLTIPSWLGGAWSARYIITHAWTRWLILWPIIKLNSLKSGAGQ